ncbi:MAG: hypothetical protein LLG44_01360 [Chloroflexi bacterium]|nr:hypothetical protein [Chloroflexota bacterium]
MDIGKVVSSDSHVAYYGQIFNKGETLEEIRPADYALGRFVGLTQPDGMILVGLLANTLIYNPDFGNMGPRLTQRAEVELFAPDFLAEKTILVHILLIGALDREGRAQQGYPLVSSVSDAPIRLLEDGEIDRFHHPRSGRLALSYLPLLLANPDPILRCALTELLSGLMLRYPDDADRLGLIAENLAWKTHIEPMA